MDNKDDIPYLIEKQFSKNLSRQERKSLKKWYNDSAENRQQYKDYYALLKYLRISKNKELFDAEVDSAYQRFRKRIDQLNVKNPLTSIFRPWVRYAAVFAIAFGAGVFSYYVINSDFSGKYLTQNIEIPFGSKSKVTLPDGTAVWLNSGSRLSYQKSFGQTDRDVLLDGEGYFEVTKNEALPFRVLSGKLKIRVLGTKFNFKSYEEDENARVTLVEGSLNVADLNDEKQEVRLIPNQQAVINKKHNQFIVKSVDAHAYAMWTELKPEIIEAAPGSSTGQVKASIRTPNVTLRNILFFDEEPLEQIVRDLERVYNVKIHLKGDNLEEERFYGDFRNEETLTDILEIMANNNNLYYAIEGNEIIISKK